jgi:hypothetical protein
MEYINWVLLRPFKGVSEASTSGTETSTPTTTHHILVKMFTPKTIAVFLAFTSLTIAQDVDYDDLPSQCTQVCDPVVRLTQQCDQGKNDADQLQCVCSAMNATMQIPACEACFAMFDSDGHDNGEL